MARWDQQCIWSTGMQVGPLAQHSERVKDLALPQLKGHSCNLDLIPDPGTSYAAGQTKKKKKAANKFITIKT